ncbi:MAG TPA: hypothetical protein VFB06_25860 [Streptosporangiaceae bacterium]|nr:hypothetical protein [Streptosporangiaceae bacterium]
MSNDEIERVRSAVTAIAAAIINSFMITHSIIITVIVTVSVLTVALSWVSQSGVGLETANDLEAGFHGDACLAAYLIEGRTGGAMSFDRLEAAERWSQKKRLDRPCRRLGQTRRPGWRPF